MTETKKPFSIGDYIVDFEKIYKITSQKSRQDFSGQTRLYFLYEPIDEPNNKATYLIPVDNIIESGFRALISRNTAENLYRQAGEKIDYNFVLDFKLVKEILYENNPQKNLVILKQLFLEKENKPNKFLGANKYILESILRHLSEEIAFVTKTPLENVQEKLISLITKTIK